MATPFPFVAGAVLEAAELNAITNLPINDQTANYTLVAGDAGKRVIMNNAGATTITVNDNVFTTGDTIFIANKGAGTCTITAGTATVNTSGSLALAQYGGGTLVALSASIFTFFPSGGIGYGTATGGSSSSITVSGVNYTLLTFTTSGTLTVTKSGLFDCLVVGAGASGGIRSADRAAGGGGGGQVLQQTIYLTANETVTIGAKGVGVTVNQTNGNRGTYSAVAQLSAGGGGGGKAQGGVDNAAGSGGGGVGTTTAEGGGLAGSLVGANNGGNGGAGTTAGGGGGGSSQAGQANSSTTGGAGGTGTDVATFISGATLYHGAGGGGASIGGTGGTAGNSTGGNGGSSGAGSSATATNYGCGGGGGVSTTSGAGADGVVYVRFKV